MTLAAGLPQLVIAPDLEKRLIGSEILRLGVGAMLRGHDATADGIVAAIDAINADAGMAQRARALGNSLAPLLQRDSAQQIADVALAACA